MIETMLWISLRFVPVALALGLACAGVHRAMAAQGAMAYLHAVFAVFAFFAGLTVLPWALHQAPLDLTALALALVCVPVWWLIEAVGPHRHRAGRPVDRPMHPAEAGAVRFRHRPLPPRPILVLTPAERVAPVSRPEPSPAPPTELAFLPRRPAVGLH